MKDTLRIFGSTLMLLVVSPFLQAFFSNEWKGITAFLRQTLEASKEFPAAIWWVLSFSIPIPLSLLALSFLTAVATCRYWGARTSMKASVPQTVAVVDTPPSAPPLAQVEQYEMPVFQAKLVAYLAREDNCGIDLAAMARAASRSQLIIQKELSELERHGYVYHRANMIHDTLFYLTDKGIAFAIDKGFVS